MKRYIFFLLATLLSAVSCSSPRYVSSQPYMQDEWTGRTHAEIIQEFGAPDRELSDGADGLILVYESFSSNVSGHTIYTSREFIEFYLDADGSCYDVRTNGQRRDGRQFSFLKTFLLATTVCLAAVLPYYTSR